MRRKPGMLVPLEVDICLCAAAMAADGSSSLHGYELAKALARGTDRAELAAYGTLYRALARLVDMGLMTSKWEDPATAERQGRPRRRLYTLTAAGRRAAREATDVVAAVALRRLKKGLTPA